MTQPAIVSEGVESRRVALVTGGGRGSGAAVVHALADRGYAIAIHAHASLREARAMAEALTASGIESLAVTANMREEGPVRAMVQRVADHFGRIDALVSCVGLRRSSAWADLTADDLRLHFEVNCVGMFVTAQEAGAFMVRQADGGDIVALGEECSPPFIAGSTAAMISRSSTPALVGCLATELAALHKRVRVNGVLHSHGATAGQIPEVVQRVVWLLEHPEVNGVCLKAHEALPGSAGRPTA